MRGKIVPREIASGREKMQRRRRALCKQRVYSFAQKRVDVGARTSLAGARTEVRRGAYQGATLVSKRVLRASANAFSTLGKLGCAVLSRFTERAKKAPRKAH